MLLKNLVSPETVPSLAVFAGHGVSFGEQIELSHWWRFVWNIEIHDFVSRINEFLLVKRHQSLSHDEPRVRMFFL